MLTHAIWTKIRLSFLFPYPDFKFTVTWQTYRRPLSSSSNSWPAVWTILCIVCVLTPVCLLILCSFAKRVYKQVSFKLSNSAVIDPKGCLAVNIPWRPLTTTPPVCNSILRLMLIRVQIRLTHTHTGDEKKVLTHSSHTLRQRRDKFAFRRKWLSRGVRG